MVTAATGVSTSTDVIKKATRNLKPDPHDQADFKLVWPLLQCFQNANRGFKFDIKADAEGHLERIVAVFGYAGDILKHAYCILGLDAAHFKDIVIELEPKTLLKKMMISAIVVRVPNMANLILGFVISYSECAADIKPLVTMLTEMGVDVNVPSFAVFTDNGSALGKVCREELPNVLNMLCAKHLENQLKQHGGKKILAQFWRARKAVTKVQYQAAMTDMPAEPLAYLNGLSVPFALYVAVARGNRLYEKKTSNQIEQTFSYLLEARFYGLYQFLFRLLSLNCSRIVGERAAAHAKGGTVLTPYAARSHAMMDEKRKRHQLKCDYDPTTEQAMVYTSLQNTFSGRHFHVNLREKTCDCGQWHQLDEPCEHAWETMLVAKIPIERLFSEEFFGAVNLRANWQEMFEYPSTLVVMVGSNEVENLYSTSPAFPALKPILVVDTTSSTAKRIKSGGEASSASTISAKNYKQERVTCSRCQKNISRDTKHLLSACDNWIRRTDYVAPTYDVGCASVQVPQCGALALASSSTPKTVIGVSSASCSSSNTSTSMLTTFVGQASSSSAANAQTSVKRTLCLTLTRSWKLLAVGGSGEIGSQINGTYDYNVLNSSAPSYTHSTNGIVLRVLAGSWAFQFADCSETNVQIARLNRHEEKLGTPCDHGVWVVWDKAAKRTFEQEHLKVTHVDSERPHHTVQSQGPSAISLPTAFSNHVSVSMCIPFQHCL